jgi:hypothetical protein
MATSVNFARFFVAALAAVLTFTLTACGGGEEVTSQEVQDKAIRQALTGPVVANPQAIDFSRAKTQKRALATPVAASQYGGLAVFTAKTLSQGAKTAQVAAATSPTGITPDELGDWAEATFNQEPANYFPSHQVTGSATLDGDGDGELETYAYRMYPETGNCFGVRTAGKDVGGIYLCGPYVGNQIVRYAHIDDRHIKCLVNVEVLGCQPRVTSVTPADGATGVDIKNVVITAVFDQRLACPEAPIIGTFGIITGTLTCANGATTATVTIVAETLPENSLITAALSGFLSEDLIAAMVPQTWSFATRKGIVVVLETKVVSANWRGHYSEAASIIDPVTSGVSRVEFATVPGYIIPMQIAVDNKRGIVYVGASHTTYVLHRFDIKTGKELQWFPIEFPFTQAQAIQGIAVTPDDRVCIVTGFLDGQSVYTQRNRLICFNPDTGERVFVSATDFVASATQTPTRLLYSDSRNKFYILTAADGAMFVEGGVGARDGYNPGTVGTLVEIDAASYRKERVWTNIGSMPLDAAPIENWNKLLIAVAGDHKLVTVDLVKRPNEVGAVTGVNWSGLFGQYSYPTNILSDEAKGVYYVSDWYDSVRVMSLSTHQQIGRIVISGSTPRGLTIANGDLWVAAPREAVWSAGQKTYVIDRTTRLVKRSIVTGNQPWNLVTYQRTEIQ